MSKVREIGMNIHLNSEVQSVQKTKAGFTIEASQNGQTLTLSGNIVVHGSGRVPDIDDMNLEKGNIERTKKGIHVNAFLQSSSNPRVYATGDAADTDGLPLTPVAGFESHIVASNLLDGNHKKADHPAQPTVVFTIPPLAMVGLTEQQARDTGYKIQVTLLSLYKL